MKLISLTILIISIFESSLIGQTSIDMVRVGEKMPEQIDIGGFTEQDPEGCMCRLFTIENHFNKWEIGNGGAVTLQTVAIHYNEQDTIVGKIKIKLRLDIEDAYKVYISRLSEYLRTQSFFKNRQLIKARDSDNGVVDGIYYFTYHNVNSNLYRSVGVIEFAIIEETYIPNSSYKPRLIN